MDVLAYGDPLTMWGVSPAGRLYKRSASNAHTQWQGVRMPSGYKATWVACSNDGVVVALFGSQGAHQYYPQQLANGSMLGQEATGWVPMEVYGSSLRISNSRYMVNIFDGTPGYVLGHGNNQQLHVNVPGMVQPVFTSFDVGTDGTMAGICYDRAGSKIPHVVRLHHNPLQSINTVAYYKNPVRWRWQQHLGHTPAD